MLLNDTIMLSGHLPFKKIFETATEMKPKLFFSVDRVSGRNCLDVLSSDRSSFAKRPWFNYVLDYKGTIQLKFFAVTEVDVPSNQMLNFDAVFEPLY